MYINSIELINFRNHINKKVEFKEGLNIILGKNAVGKTNIAEAIFFCAVGKSIRVINQKEVINFDKDYMYLKIHYCRANKNKTIEISLDKESKKQMVVHHIETKRVQDLISNFVAVFFSPETINMVKEGPTERRKFMDICLCQEDTKYLKNLNLYNKALAQRNKLLKEAYNDEEKIKLIKLWDRQIIDYEIYIYEKRKNFINYLNDRINEKHSFITLNKEKLTLLYETQIKENREDLKSMLVNQINANIEKDLKLGFTSFGIHRDDILIIINDQIDARKYASQGQQRTIALSLKITEALFLEQKINEKPVIILDDVLSELDLKRKKLLLESLDGFQTIITTTSIGRIKNSNIIKIK